MRKEIDEKKKIGILRLENLELKELSCQNGVKSFLQNRNLGGLKSTVGLKRTVECMESIFTVATKVTLEMRKPEYH